MGTVPSDTWQRTRLIPDTLSQVFGVLAGAIIVVVTLWAVLDIFARNVGGFALPGVFDYGEVALVTAVFLSFPEAQRTQTHVASDIITMRLRPRVRAMTEVIGLLVVIPALAWTTWVSVGSAIDSWREGEARIGVRDIPLWPGRAVVVLGLALLTFQVMLTVGELLRDMRRSSEAGGGTAQHTLRPKY